MGQLYLEFDEKELKKNLELFERIQKEKNGDLEEAFKLFADKYINDEMDLAVFLQVINIRILFIKSKENYKKLLSGILKVKDFMIKNNKKQHLNIIYELLIYIYYNIDNSEEVTKLSHELINLYEKNKVASFHLDKLKDENIEWAYILHNILCYESNKDVENLQLFYKNHNAIVNNKEFSDIIEKSFKDEIEELFKEELKKLLRGVEKIDSLDKNAILSEINEIINSSEIDNIINSYKYLIDIIKPCESYDYINKKYGGIDKLVHIYLWDYHTYLMPDIDLKFLKNSLATLYNHRYEISDNIKDKNKCIRIEDLLDKIIIILGQLRPIDNSPFVKLIEDNIKNKFDEVIRLIYEIMEKDKRINKIINIIDFNISKVFLTDIINKIAGKIVIDNSIEIKNKKILIDIYEIISVSRKELIVMRLFDYIRNADAYANMKINNDTEELETDRIARWKGENVEIKNEYILCYHFHSSSEIQYKKDEYGNFQLNEKGEKIPIRISVRGERRKTIWRKFPAENWIAVNQIRDTLAHRINENDTDVNEAIRTTKNAREFIEANFTSIIECLFNVIKENGLLTDDKFNREDF